MESKITEVMYMRGTQHKEGLAVVNGLYVYPIKSAGGIALPSADVSTRGFRYDRRWMLVDDGGKLITQRRFPGIALITVCISEECLVIDAPDMPSLSTPLLPEKESYSYVPVQVWNDHTQGLPVGKEADSWFSTYLDSPCRLVYMPEDADRPLDWQHRTNDDQVSFADWFPFHMVSEASFYSLNKRLERSVAISRFRPNIVINGCTAFAEDDWAYISIGTVRFQVAVPCPRCSVVNIDQQTGVRGRGEPLRTLSQYRRVGKEVWFGRHLVHDEQGELRVGDAVEVLASRRDETRRIR